MALGSSMPSREDDSTDCHALVEKCVAAPRRSWFFRTIIGAPIFEEPSIVGNTSILKGSLFFDQ